MQSLFFEFPTNPSLHSHLPLACKIALSTQSQLSFSWTRPLSGQPKHSFLSEFRAKFESHSQIPYAFGVALPIHWHVSEILADLPISEHGIQVLFEDWI